MNTVVYLWRIFRDITKSKRLRRQDKNDVYHTLEYFHVRSCASPFEKCQSHVHSIVYSMKCCTVQGDENLH